jgi:RNA polymerase sigma factor (sigma-70 family)
VLYARQWCANPDDAVQDALVDLANQATDPRDPVGWLYKTARCKAMNQARSEQRRTKHQQLAAQERDAWFQFDPSADVGAEEVEVLLGELSELEREIVVARIWGDLSFEQIAELVDRSLSFVYRHYQQALSKLEKKIDRQSKRIIKYE